MRGSNRKQMTFGDDYLFEKAPVHPTLEGVNQFVDWQAIDRLLAKAYPSEMGRPSYPPRILFKTLLLAQWFGLSDRDLEFQLRDRLSFQRFLGLGLADAVPDSTTLCRFRQRLLETRLYEKLFAAVQRQLDSRDLLVKKGTLIDATFVQAYSRPRMKGGENNSKDPDAKWAVKAGQARYGYKLHVAVDQGSGLVRRFVTTPGNTNDGSQFDRVYEWDTAAVFADKAYSSYVRKRRLRGEGIFCGIIDKGQSHRPLNRNQLKRNAKLSRIRSAVERCFAHLKWHMGFYRGKYKGLAKMAAHACALLIAYNLKRAVTMTATV